MATTIPRPAFGVAANLLIVARQRNRLRQALDRVEALADEWDALTKGESPTTQRIRAAIRGDERA